MAMGARGSMVVPPWTLRMTTESGEGMKCKMAGETCQPPDNERVSSIEAESEASTSRLTCQLTCARRWQIFLSRCRKS